LVKLALAVGSARQGAVHAHVRRGLAAGLTPEEIRQVALLGITTLGWPQAFAALCWIDDKLARGTD
jgi:alkylhydroperoxidase/carboxymuconolactone decarboxylase family protein YurZ